MIDNENNKDSDIKVKLLLIGNTFVGKTLIVQKFIDEKFAKQTMNTVGVELQSKVVEVNGKKVKYLIWDTAGQDRMKTMAYSYYRGCDIILIVFDVHERSSFGAISNWVECVEKFAKPTALKVLVGNKIDLPDRNITTDEGKKLAEDYGFEYYEISALKLQGLKEMFEDIAKIYIKEYELRSAKIFSLDLNQTKKRKGCC